jgi:hypothetical protein
MVLLQLDHPQRFAAAPALEHRGREIDHRPAEPGQQPQGAGEIRQQKLYLLVPGQYGFHRELRKRLQPRQYGQRKPLRDKELGRLGRPGNDDRRDQNRRRRPKQGGGASLRKRHNQQE